MSNIELTSHARDMLQERKIPEEWVWRTIQTPDDKKWHVEDDHVHYTKSTRERDGRILRVVVDQNAHPHHIVTVFFDRRLRKDR